MYCCVLRTDNRSLDQVQSVSIRISMYVLYASCNIAQVPCEYKCCVLDCWTEILPVRECVHCRQSFVGDEHLFARPGRIFQQASDFALLISLTVQETMHFNRDHRSISCPAPLRQIIQSRYGVRRGRRASSLIVIGWMVGLKGERGVSVFGVFNRQLDTLIAKVKTVKTV